ANSDGGTDLEVQVIAPDYSSLDADVLWAGSVLLKNYHTGDFGLTFKVDNSYQDYEEGKITSDQFDTQEAAALAPFLSTPERTSYVDDDPTQPWNGVHPWNGIYSWPPPSFSDAQLTLDLQTVLARTDGTGTISAFS